MFSFPHPRGSDLLKASSDVAQQHELSLAFSEQRLWETSPGASAQGFRAIFKLRPWPGLLCQSVHSTQLCSPLSGIVGTLGEVPACSPLAQPCCVLTLRHPFWGSPELEASHGLCAAVYTTHKQAFPLSFNVPVPVAAGWWLEAGAAGTEDTCPTEGCWTARTAQLHPHPSNQGTINCWSTLDRLLERASSTWVTPEPNPEHSLVWDRQSTASCWSQPKQNTHGQILRQYQWNPAAHSGSQVLLQFRSSLG